MAATNAQIAEVRRMVAEPDSATYLHDVLARYIERYPVVDERGEAPYTWDTATTPPTQETNDDWVATYDLRRAAADVWEEKAAALAGNYDFQVEGRRFSRAQTYEQAMKMARYYRSRRTLKTLRAVVEPPVVAEDRVWIGNLAEPEDMP